MDLSNSRREFTRAKRSIPGGVNSPVRAYASVGGTPRFIESAKGARVRDIDGNEYIDYVGSWGPMILGHSHPKVLAAVRSAMKEGTSFGAPTPRETDLAEAIRSVLPSVQKVRMVSSGTEATMSALRLARGVTGRNRILKFDGCYHGHSDGLLVGAGSGVATLGIPGSPGVPKAMTDLTIVAPYNDLAATRRAFERWGKDIAAIIVEPIAGNMGCIPPVAGFLKGLRALCDEFGAILIFDEVMTGFRVARGGAQRLYKVKPDLTTLGKVVGGGLPAAAYGGRKDLMSRIAPEGDVYQAGTLSGNPLAVAAGLATLELLEAGGVYEKLSATTEELAKGLSSLGEELGIPISTRAIGGMFGFFFHPGPVNSFVDAQQSDAARFKRFFKKMLEQGVYLAPSPYEAGFVSLAHTKRDVKSTLEAARKALT
ncbi:MAG: glutamate-1-semialdehyde 2,1-aminomutase [Myxococcota bacterium]